MNKKKVASIALATVILMGSGKSFAKDAIGKKADILLNNNKVSLEAYEISGNNYFKLRDLAQIINKTDKKFNVKWNKEADAVEIISNSEYESDGSELKIKDNLGKSNSNKTKSKILYDGKELDVDVYNINGNNYFKLRDLNEKLDIFTGYNNKTKIIEMDTSKAYVKETPKAKEKPSNDKLDKVKKDIQSGKYGKEVYAKVLDIIFADFNYNNKPNIVALVSKGGNFENLQILNISNDGKFINKADALGEEDTEKINLYAIDTMQNNDSGASKEKQVTLVKTINSIYSGKYLVEDGYEYYEGELVEFKKGVGMGVGVVAKDDYKLNLYIPDSEGKMGKTLIIDLSDNEIFKKEYYNNNAKAKSIEEANEGLPYYGDTYYGNIKVEAESVEKYVDAKTGFEGLKYFAE